MEMCVGSRSCSDLAYLRFLIVNNAGSPYENVLTFTLNTVNEIAASLLFKAQKLPKIPAKKKRRLLEPSQAQPVMNPAPVSSSSSSSSINVTETANPAGNVDAVLHKLGLPKEFFDDTFPVSAPRVFLVFLRDQISLIKGREAIGVKVVLC